MLAPGGPGAPPSWGPGRKDGFGTAAGSASRVWFTIARGNLSEVFYPALDQPALHDLRFFIAAPGIPPVDDAAEAVHRLTWLRPGVPALTVESRHDEYVLVKEYLCDPELNALLIAGTFDPGLPDLRLYLQAGAHVRPQTPGNDASVSDQRPPVLHLRQGDTHIAISGPFKEATAGYREASDLQVQLHDSDGDFEATYTEATAGNVTVGAQLGIHAGAFQVAVGFGRSRPDAEEAAREMLRKGAARVRDAFAEAWRVLPDLPKGMAQVSGDEGALAAKSLAVLRCLEDKEARGAFVAAPAAPWGESSGDGNLLYHVVWARDLYHVTTALLAAGDVEPAMRGLHYLARMQRADGCWAQNWALGGRPHWTGLELDQAAYPVLLAWRLRAADALDWDAWRGLVSKAVTFIVRSGPNTPLDRWEDAGGLSPSTLAAAIAALICAAEMAEEAAKVPAATHLRAVADYWADRLEQWCFWPQAGSYARLGQDPISGPGPGSVLSADFLELVRLGVRRADDPSILQSLPHVDAALRVATPGGPVWRRYVNDRYGEHDDGSPWDGNGTGRAWPLLLGERAHHQFALTGNASDLARMFEGFASQGGMLPEQVWYGDPVPSQGLIAGQATGSAAPLGWAHAEYVKLLATIAGGRVADLLEPVRSRYCGHPPDEPAFVWSRVHAFSEFVAGRKVLIQLDEEAVVRWSADDWISWKEVPTVDTGLGVHVAALPTQIMRPGASMSWTPHYSDRWEGRNFTLTAR